jgi:hypothetical protein
MLAKASLRKLKLLGEQRKLKVRLRRTLFFPPLDPYIFSPLSQFATTLAGGNPEFLPIHVRIGRQRWNIRGLNRRANFPSYRRRQA